MKFPRTFLITFAIAGLLLLVQAWLPNALGIAVGFGIMTLFLGGFAALAIQVGSDFTGRRRFRIAGLVGVGLLLSIGVLGWALDILPYIWNGIAVLLLCLVVLLLGAGLAWQCGRDYFEMFLPRTPPAAPSDWHTLEAGQLPTSNAEASAHSKERFAHSYGVHITCTPRAGAMGLISHPLKMDE